jgi:lipid II:glycine glycyltransferase (peptidoglycan interpeptide bridge formation enzyme)
MSKKIIKKKELFFPKSYPSIIEINLRFINGEIESDIKQTNENIEAISIMITELESIKQKLLEEYQKMIQINNFEIADEEEEENDR